MNNKPLVIAAAVIIVGVLFFFWSSSDEQKIVRTLKELCEIASIPGEEHPLESLGRAKQVGSFATEDVKVIAHITYDQDKTKEIMFENRKTIIEKVAAARRYGRAVKVGFADPTVEIDGDEAEVQLTCTAEGTDPDNGEKYLEAIECLLKMKKIGGDWLIAEAKNIETIIH